MTALEDARATLADYEALGIGTSDAAGVLRALIAEYERLTSEMHHRELHHFETEQMLVQAGIDPDVAPPTDDEREARDAFIEGAKLDARNSMRHDPRVWYEALEAALDKVLPEFWDRAAGFRRQGPITDAQVDRVAKAIARAADADYWTTEIAEWEDSEEWEREAHPDNYPSTAYEDREWYRKQARAALEAVREADR